MRSRASVLMARSTYRARTRASWSVSPFHLSGSGRRHLPISRQLLDDQRPGARPAVAHRAGHLDEVAEIDGAGEVGGAAAVRAANCPAAVELHRTSRAAARTARRRSRGSAAPARPPSRAAPSAASIACGDGVAGCLPDGVGVDAAVLQRLELGHPDADLLGQPRLVLVLGQIGLRARRGRARCRRDAAGPVATRFSGAAM